MKCIKSRYLNKGFIIDYTNELHTYKLLPIGLYVPLAKRHPDAVPVQLKNEHPCSFCGKFVF